MSLVRNRPNFPNVLAVTDLNIGERVTLHHTGSSSSEDLIIWSGPREIDGRLRMIMKYVRGNNRTEMFLADMGIVPYPNGFWNEYNYTTLAE